MWRFYVRCMQPRLKLRRLRKLSPVMLEVPVRVQVDGMRLLCKSCGRLWLLTVVI